MININNVCNTFLQITCYQATRSLRAEKTLCGFIGRSRNWQKYSVTVKPIEIQYPFPVICGHACATALFVGVSVSALILSIVGGLLDVPRCRCYDQHCVVMLSAPPLHPPLPAAPPPLSHPACRPFWSLPPAWTLTVRRVTYNTVACFLGCLRTSSLGLMLYSILSAFSLSWRLSIIASSSLEALFCKSKHNQLRFILPTWCSTFQTEEEQ